MMRNVNSDGEPASMDLPCSPDQLTEPLGGKDSQRFAITCGPEIMLREGSGWKQIAKWAGSPGIVKFGNDKLLTSFPEMPASQIYSIESLQLNGQYGASAGRWVTEGDNVLENATKNAFWIVSRDNTDTLRQFVTFDINTLEYRTIWDLPAGRHVQHLTTEPNNAFAITSSYETGAAKLMRLDERTGAPAIQVDLDSKIKVRATAAGSDHVIIATQNDGLLVFDRNLRQTAHIKTINKEIDRVWVVDDVLYADVKNEILAIDDWLN